MMDRYTGKLIDERTHVEQCVDNILMTPTDTRVMDLPYGTDLIALADIPLDGVGRATIVSKVVAALRRFEPRIDVERVTVEAGSDSTFTNIYGTLNGERIAFVTAI